MIHEHALTRKDQIYHVAERLFSERGYHATTMREIAREVDIEGGSLYSHISSKQDLLYAIVLRGSERFLHAARTVMAMNISAREQLQELMHRHLAIIAESIDGAVVHFHEWRHLDPAKRKKIEQHRDEYEGYIRQIIRRGMDNGEFAPQDERLVGIHILSLLNWAYQWYKPEGRLSADALAQQFYEQIMSGLDPRNM